MTRDALSPDTRRQLDRLRAELSQLPWHFARDGQGWLLRPLYETLKLLRADAGPETFAAAARSVLGPLPAHREPKPRLQQTDVAAVVTEIDRRAERLASHQLAELIRDLLHTFEDYARLAAA